jgi:D-alanyl-D-alanine carboxypeptidase
MALCVGSITKTCIAALCVKLADEGWFSLDDSLHSWLPDYQFIDNSITIRQLLWNTSGLHNITDNLELWEAVFIDPSRLWTPEEILSEYLDEPYADPGTGWYYSNTNYLLLGMIIKKATGSEASYLLRDRFFKPLGLNQTYFAIEEELPSNTAHGWFNLSGNGDEDVSLISNNGIYSALWTSAAIFATTENLARWCSDLFQGKVLNEESLDQMLYPCCTLPGTINVGCAMGLFLFGPSNNTGVELIGYTGRTFGYLASMFFLPGNGMSIAVMINEDDSQLLDEITTTLILEALETDKNP